MIEAGYDPARLPPGPVLTEKWPVLHAGSIPKTDLATWDFFVEGEVESPIRLSWDELNALPRTTHTQDIHCVTRWSRFDVTFEGVHWSALEPLVEAARVRALRRRPRRGGLHGERADLVPPRSAVAARDARRRRAADAGARRPAPARRSRGKYFWKSAKWLRGIELTRERPARLLGALRLPQRRRPVRGGAIRLLIAIEGSAIPPGRGTRPGAPFRRKPG